MKKLFKILVVTILCIATVLANVACGGKFEAVNADNREDFAKYFAELLNKTPNTEAEDYKYTPYDSALIGKYVYDEDNGSLKEAALDIGVKMNLDINFKVGDIKVSGSSSEELILNSSLSYDFNEEEKEYVEQPTTNIKAKLVANSNISSKASEKAFEKLIDALKTNAMNEHKAKLDAGKNAANAGKKLQGSLEDYNNLESILSLILNKKFEGNSEIIFDNGKIFANGKLNFGEISLVKGKEYIDLYAEKEVDDSKYLVNAPELKKDKSTDDESINYYKYMVDSFLEGGVYTSLWYALAELSDGETSTNMLKGFFDMFMQEKVHSYDEEGKLVIKEGAEDNPLYGLLKISADKKNNAIKIEAGDKMADFLKKYIDENGTFDIKKAVATITIKDGKIYSVDVDVKVKTDFTLSGVKFNGTVAFSCEVNTAKLGKIKTPKSTKGYYDFTNVMAVLSMVG